MLRFAYATRLVRERSTNQRFNISLDALTHSLPGSRCELGLAICGNGLCPLIAMGAHRRNVHDDIPSYFIEDLANGTGKQNVSARVPAKTFRSNSGITAVCPPKLHFGSIYLQMCHENTSIEHRHWKHLVCLSIYARSRFHSMSCVAFVKQHSFPQASFLHPVRVYSKALIYLHRSRSDPRGDTVQGQGQG